MGTTVNVEHVDRVSDEMAELADELSRKSVSNNPVAAAALEAAPQKEVKGFLLKWLEDPKTGESLSRELVKELGKVLSLICFAESIKRKR